MIMKKLFTIAFGFFCSFIFAQQLQPNANYTEIKHSLILAQDIQTPFHDNELEQKTNYTNLYRSPEIGLTNRWGLYFDTNRQVAEIAIRGSVDKGNSWLANYYAAMIPAKGEIKLSNNKGMTYNFCDDPKAYVHTGWTIASLYLLADMKPKIDSLYKANKKEIIVSGHSQGGVISFLVTAQLKQWQKDGTLPTDIIFKTYALAPPKPGNNYFAYQYEKTMKNWSFSVINTQDWVPEVPPTTQMLQDFNPISPFSKSEIDKTIKKIKWPKRWFARGMYNRMSNPLVKNVKRYRNTLGHFVFEQIHKSMPELIEPTYVLNSDYSRCGNPIILDGLFNQEYQTKFNKPENTMTHHMPNAYLFLLNNLEK